MAIGLMVVGCAVRPPVKPTVLMAAPWGQTYRVTQYQPLTVKPSAYVVWGNDVRDGARCRITITNATKKVTVYRYDFKYRVTPFTTDWSFFKGKIIEPDSTWNKVIGDYIIELKADGYQVGTDRFVIRP